MPPTQGTRLGHAETIHGVLAAKVLLGHLQNRHQLLDPPPTNLADLCPEDAALLVRAMIAAAHADGEIDEQERGRIAGVLDSAPLDAEARDRLVQAMAEPQCLETLARRVASPNMASRFYAVSLAALDRNGALARAYLRFLALRLGLPADMVVRMNLRMGLRT